MDIQQYWTVKHQKYQAKDWINKPSIFANQCLKYLPQSGSLLELGAGQGQDSRFFASKGLNVLSTDISTSALQIARAKTKKQLPNLKYQKVDISKPLPFPNNNFDVVYSHLGLHYFNQKDTQQLFREIQRILKPNGIFASIFNTINDPEIQKAKKLENHFYIAPDKLQKAYFSTNYLKKLTQNLFKPIVLDNQGITHKDEIRTLIRFIGTKK